MAAGSTNYADPSLLPWVQYHYRVKATGGSGDSNWSATASATVLPASTKCFTSWVDDKIANASMRGEGADADGIPNIVEYVLGLSPMINELIAEHVWAEVCNAQLKLHHTRNADLTDIVYCIDVS